MLCLIFALLLAQSPTVPTEFDVVSVKPSAPDLQGNFMFQSLPGGTIRIVGVPLRMIIMQAYHLRAFQVSGGPDWVRSECWDILAKAETTAGRLPPAEEDRMLKALMEDRFHLKVHSETKEAQVYALEVGKNGSKLVPSTQSARDFRTKAGSLDAKKSKVASLVSWLSPQLGRVVIDETNLEGEFDYKLEWTPEPGQGGPEAFGLPPDTRGTPPAETNGPSIFTALQEQLGLRLVSEKGPVEMIVIDYVERASAN